jgi:hypothetical protein
VVNDFLRVNAIAFAAAEPVGAGVEPSQRRQIQS